MFEQSLIHSDWNFTIWAFLLLLVAFGFWSDKTKLGSSVSGAAIIMAAGMILSNFKILPMESDVYGVVWSYLVPLGIPLLLLKADLRRVIAETKGMMIAFFLGAIGTTIGALVGYAILPIGSEAEKLAGVLSATYIGGSMNMVAVTQAVELDPSIVTATVAADNVIGVMYLVFLGLAPSIVFMQRLFKSNTSSLDADVSNSNTAPTAPATINLNQIGLALGLAFAICAVGKAMAGYLGVGGYSIMFITAITLLVANTFPKQIKTIKGDYEVGLFFMYLFFAAIGVSADVAAMLDKALVIAFYAAIIIIFHAVVIFGFSRFFKLDLFEVVITSNACASGPASAAALAAGRGRADLVAPAILLGVFGYAVANFIGVGLTHWLGA